MKKLLTVFNSSEINRYNMVFTINSLESGLNQSWEFGLPSNMSHDLHRPIGWSFGRSLHLEPGLVRTIGEIHIAESLEENEVFLEASQKRYFSLAKEELDKNLTEFQEKLGGSIPDDAIPVMTNCVAFLKANAARNLFPKIFADEDKYGLVSLSDLNQVAPGVFSSGGLLFFAHPYFRKSLSRLNSLNSQFLSALQNLSKQAELALKIRLDPDLVGLESTLLEHIELAYWYGPKFENDLSKIALGVTRHEADETEKKFNGVSSTEFWWHEQNDLKTLEVEELVDLPSFGVGSDRFGCRYVHSIVSPDSSIPCHLDGAIRLYDEIAILERIEKKITEAGRHSNYTKLWRVDGPIQVSDWKKLLTHYFRDNYLVGEYLGAKREKTDNLPKIIRDDTESIDQLCPCNMNPGDGIRISVTYVRCSANKEEEVRVYPSMRMVLKDQAIEFINDSSIDLIKLLRLEHKAIFKEEHHTRIAFNDLIINLPVIVHLGSRSSENATLTKDAVAKLLRRWAEKGDNRLISCNFQIQYSKKDIIFSFAGHVIDLVDYFMNDFFGFPSEEEEMGNWTEKTYSMLTKKSKKAENFPPLWDYYQNNGLLTFDRIFIENLELEYLDERKALVAKVPINERFNPKILKEYPYLSIGAAMIVEKSTCSKCNRDYYFCECNKTLENDVIQIMEKFQMLGGFWTIRKA